MAGMAIGINNMVEKKESEVINLHSKLFVLIHKERAKNSREARQYVFDELIQDPSFCGSEGWGKFKKPICDWFVIGGRLSGKLTKLLLDQDKVEIFEKEFKKKHGWWISKEITKDMRQKQSIELFKTYFPQFQGMHPYWRDSYTEIGYEDDAMIVSKELWEALKREYNDNIPLFPDIEKDKIIDLDFDIIKEQQVVDKKWMVIVDYHS